MKKPEVPKLGDARSSYIIVGGVRGGGVLAVRSGLFLSLGEGRGGGVAVPVSALFWLEGEGVRVRVGLAM